MSKRALLRMVPGGAALGVLGVHLVDPVPGALAWSALATLVAGAALRRTPKPVQNRDEYAEARTDLLTGLTNRRGFLEELDRRLATDEPLALLITDLNGFKEVNDSLGHLAGDELLRAVASRFAEPLEAGAFLARLGGDEFGILVPVADPVAALRRADLINETLLLPFALEGISVRIGASTGVAVRHGRGVTASDLLRQADMAMYDAKRRDTDALLYDSESDPNGRERIRFVEELRDALAASAFTLHLQPIMHLASGQVAGAEALVRWPHPRLGLLYPDAFIPLAEKLGMMPQMTRCILELALTSMSGLDPGLSLNVNISARDLADEGLAQHVADRLDHHGVAAERLTLELTETSLGTDHLRAAKQLQAFSRIGVNVAIDDFGAGMSSTSELAALAIGTLKLDPSLMRASSGDVQAGAVLRSAVELAAALSIKVVAEAVESEETHRYLISLGVTHAQGYHYAPPLPVKGFSGFVDSHRQSAADGAITR